MTNPDSISSGGKSPSRGSSSRSSACRRPKLMRSSATAPCLATSNACRNDLAYLHSSPRATALLSRVASYSTSRSDQANCQRPPQDDCRRSVSPPGERMIHDFAETLDGQKKSMYNAQGLYFSFPSFEDFDGEHDEDRDDSGKLSN